MGGFQIPLAVQAPQPRSALTSIGALMNLRGQMSEIALRQAQTETAKQNTQLQQAKQEEDNRKLAGQNAITAALKNPELLAKVSGGDYAPLYSLGVPTDIADEVAGKFAARIKDKATNDKQTLENHTTAADLIGKDARTALYKPDGTFDLAHANDVWSQFISSHAEPIRVMGGDVSALPKSIQSEDHLNQMLGGVGAEGASARAALELQGKRGEIAQKAAVTKKDEADAEQAHAQAEHLAATLPKDQADAAITQLQSDFAAKHGGLKPEEAATKEETARHNKATEAVQRGELGIKEKQFEATFGSGLDANGQPLAPEAMKAAAMQDPTALAIAHYQVAPPPVQTRGGMPSPIMRKVLAINPQYDATTYPARAETARGFSPSGQQGQAITAADTALAHLNTLSAAGEALKNNDLQLINRVANAVGAQVGATPKATYDTILNMVGPEISKSVIGAVGGEGERAATAQNFTSNLSPQQRESNIAAAVGLLGARYDKASHAYEQQMGAPLPRSLSPESQAIRQKYSGGKAGAVSVKANGKTYNFADQKAAEAFKAAAQAQGAKIE